MGVWNLKGVVLTKTIGLTWGCASRVYIIHLVLVCLFNDSHLIVYV